MQSVISFILSHKTLFLWLLVGALIAVVIVLFQRNKVLGDEVDRLSNNQLTLTTEIEHYKTKSGKDAATINQLEVTKGEFEAMFKEQVNTIKDLNLKVKRLESMTVTGTHTQTGGKTQLKDTTIYIHTTDTVYEEAVKHFEWKDDWNKISGVIRHEEVDCKYEGVDTLNIIATRVPKKFLFFRYGTKYVRVDITNANPSTQITYGKAIKIRKK